MASPILEPVDRKPQTTNVATRPQDECSVCLNMARLMNLPVTTESLEVTQLGTLDAISNTSCKRHSALTDFLSDVGQHEPQDVGVMITRGRTGVFLITFTDGIRRKFIHRYTFHFKARPGLPRHIGCALPLDSAWISLDLLRHWKLRCQKLHGDKCENPDTVVEVPQIRPQWLVDTHKLCLVPGTVADSFAALSYVWGDVGLLKTTKDKLERFQKPEAFCLDAFGRHIPRTIMDAMALVYVLGERYLWVDAFCIVQDDPVAQMNEINRMAEIYSSASITIIAGDGSHSQYGLRGLERIAEPRHVKQCICPSGEEDTLVSTVFDMRSSVLSRSAYSRRAWTFQECLFAKRRLIFHRGSVEWLCSESLWQEDLLGEVSERKGERDILNVLYRQEARFPDFESLVSAISEFQDRELGFPEDAVAAVTGFLNVFSQLFEGGFLFGMPVAFFDIALLWSPEHGTKRRKFRKQLEELLPIQQIPSWTWAGWVGGDHVHTWKRHETANDITKSKDRQITSAVQWHTMSSPSSHQRRSISPLWNEYKVNCQDPKQSLPSGWQRHESVLGPEDDPNYKYYFTHSSLPNRQWRCPFPIPQPGIPAIIPEQTPYLFCRTSRAYASAQVFVSKHEYQRFHPLIWALLDREGKQTGVLFLQDRHEKLVSEKIELISISQSTHRSPETVLYGDVVYEIFKVRPYFCHNVLWIGRKNGVAYRKGLGRVLRDDWERMKEDEEIDVILG